MTYMIVADESEFEEVRGNLRDLHESVERLFEGARPVEDVADRLAENLAEKLVANLVGEGSKLEIDDLIEALEQPPTQYEVGRGAMSYADVAWEEMREGPFSVDQAWEKLEPLMESTEADEVLRSSLARGLKNDERFRRVERDASGVWYEKRPREQLGIDERE